MTNTTVVAKTNLQNTDKVVEKEAIALEKSSKHISNSSCYLKTKSEVKSTSKTEQVFKKTASKLRDAGKNKKSLVKKKQELENEVISVINTSLFSFICLLMPVLLF
jgi:cation transport regulator ChaC